MKYFLTVFMFLLCTSFLPTSELGINSELPNVKRIATEELDCLIINAYHEARGEGKVGRLLVTQVVMNRAEKASKSFCEIVFQPKQFSWTLSKRQQVPQEVYHNLAFEIYELYHNKSTIPADFHDVTHFHEVKVSPYWSKKLVKIGTHNQHVFYKGN
jgi:N-acetylmuramoyl-L-alanine amidase